MLISYILEPLLYPERTTDHSHTHFWETLAIARVFAEAGFAVDGIAWTNQAWVPDRNDANYDFVIDVRNNLERLAPALPDAIKIFHSDTCHWRFNNQAQEERQEALEQRHGIELERHKLMPANQGVETCDLLTFLGNDFTRRTFEFAGKPSVRIPVSVPFIYDWPEEKDFDVVRRNFLWFGSGGLVHKGLDLVLEAFAGLPDHNLTVIGPIDREKDFARLYSRQLYQSSNINTVGWMDTASSDFIELCNNHLGLVYPSCAEGGGSSALTCMHAGLVPLLTESASVDFDESSGVLLGDLTIDGLRERIVWASERPASDLEQLARGAWTTARGKHTRERFEQNYRDFVTDLVAGNLL